MNGENIFRQRFTRISGLSAIRRLPRLGKIRLGIKKVSQKTGKEYPSETDYFVCPAEIKKFYGDEPKELNISFPMNDPEVIFPQCYKWYGSSMGLKCRGDGETALRLNEETKEMEERECPCELLEEGKCKQRASLVFMMPGIKIGGVYQIDLSSYHSIVDINSGIDYARALLGDNIAFVPFKLKRVPKETHAEGKKQIHYTLQLELDITEDDLAKLQEGKRLFWGQNRQYEIESPKPEDDINPAFDSKAKGAVIEPETEGEVKKEKEKEAKDQEKQKETKEPIKEKSKEQDLKKEIEESRARETQLKKDQEEGKSKLKSYQESKSIYKKKVEEEDKILLAISEKAQKVGIDSFEKLVNFALERGIIKTHLTEHIAKKVLTTNKEVYARLMKALEQPTEGDKEKLDKIFETLKEAGITTWREIAGFACMGDLIEPGTAIEDVQKLLTEDPEAVEKIINVAKIEEEREIEESQEIADEDIPDRIGKLEVKNEDAPYPDE